MQGLDTHELTEEDVWRSISLVSQDLYWAQSSFREDYHALNGIGQSSLCRIRGVGNSPLTCDRTRMTNPDDDYVYDDATGEWRPASEVTVPTQAQAVEVRDASGNVLADGDSVVLIRDLKVKGAGQTRRKGTVIKSIRLTGDPQEVDCRYEAIKGLVLRAEFLRKQNRR